MLDKLYCIANEYFYSSKLPPGDRPETFLASCVPERNRKVRKSGTDVIKLFFMLTSVEHAIFPAHKC